MSKRSKLLVAGVVTILATSLGASAPAATLGSVNLLQMDHSWCC